jgi:hypothetical protein
MHGVHWLPTERGFAATGTRFFVNVSEGEHDFAYFVTAAHVIWPDRKRKSQSPDGTMHVRINLKNGGHKIEKTCIKTEWIFHEDRQIDVCALPVRTHARQSSDGTDISYLSLPEISVPFRAALDPKMHPRLGEEVFITGAFIGRIGERRNIPVVRIGNIAALPEEPLEFTSPRRPAFLIETRSLGGISGSPVFINYEAHSGRGRSHVLQAAEVNADDPTKRREKIIVPYGLLGMMLGSHSGQYAEDFVSESDTDILPPQDADFNAGIGVAMSIADIIEFLNNNPTLRQTRNEILAERERLIGSEPASVSQEAAPRGDANPKS